MPVAFNQFDEEKALNAVLYVANAIEDPTMHSVSKILYFAEQEHLTKYGRPITGDVFCAFKDGPVPSGIYDIFKGLKDDQHFFAPRKEEFAHYFIIEKGQNVVPTGTVDKDVFSKSEIDMLNKSIAENKDL